MTCFFDSKKLPKETVNLTVQELDYTDNTLGINSIHLTIPEPDFHDALIAKKLTDDTTDRLKYV